MRGLSGVPENLPLTYADLQARVGTLPLRWTSCPVSQEGPTRRCAQTPTSLRGRLFPAQQTCCGQTRFNSGYRCGAVPLARRFADYDAVVYPSARALQWGRDNHAFVAEQHGDRSPR
ncbi:hypothetical protein ABIA33_006462 [Streptacidiphilus sp. MAP12-16]